MYEIRVGLGSCGIAAGGLEVYDELLKETQGMDVKVYPTGCVGMCYKEPLVDIIDEDGRTVTYGNVKPSMIKEIIKSHIMDGKPLLKWVVRDTEGEKKYDNYMDKQVKIVLRNCGQINPEDIEDYIKVGGYKAIQKALTMDPYDIIAEIKESGLRGRGGAGFPTWLKWKNTKEAPGNPKYIICNADEGDPGAFMDRSVLEGDPHSVLEGMMIAGYTIGAQEGIIYVRAEYPVAVKRLKIAIKQAKDRGYLGQNLYGTNFSFDIKIRQGAGAFVCGEETALIESLEGKRGMPRLKPPYPAYSGYMRKPTVINNVETLANIAWIVTNGGKRYSSYGTETSKGTKVFALTGKIKKGGLVEVPMGMTLREVIYDIGGGIKKDKKFKAVQLGGPSGGCIPESLLDTVVDYESLTKTGAIVGSGGMVVMDQDTCMVDTARFFMDFIVKESCGKCTQCRLGTRRMLDILDRICNGQGQEGDIELLEDLAHMVQSTALCGLGQTAPNPVLTTIRYFRDEYEAHIRDKKCPGGRCKELIHFSIDPEKCTGCRLCELKCTSHAITGEFRKTYHIDPDKCTKCHTCYDVCNYDAVVIS